MTYKKTQFVDSVNGLKEKGDVEHEVGVFGTGQVVLCITVESMSTSSYQTL